MVQGRISKQKLGPAVVAIAGVVPLTGDSNAAETINQCRQASTPRAATQG